MKKNSWITFFSIALIAHIGVIKLLDETFQYITKPLLMLSLLGWFISETNRISTDLRKWIIAALLFSWAGDVLLMFESRDKIFFMLGLSAFLLAHIFYIVFFHLVRVRESVKGNPWLMVIVVVYYAALITLLSPYLGDLKWPVRVYGIVISFMFMLAMHMLSIKNKIAGIFMMIGALLFLVSDSILAIDKFYQHFDAAGIIIITYCLGQFSIVNGAIEYIKKKRGE